jgi:hypothetical protein
VLETNYDVSVVLCNMSLYLVTCRYGALRWSTTIEKVKPFRADRLGAVKDGHGGLDRETDDRRTDHGWLTLGDIDE